MPNHAFKNLLKMKIVVAHDAATPGIISAFGEHEIIHVPAAAVFGEYSGADAFIDIDFDGSFFSPPGKPLLINETILPIREFKSAPGNVARFCGWNTFIGRKLWELATNDGKPKWIHQVMGAIGRDFEIVADEPGLVAPRILSMIINEACFALEEGISSPGEIDMAMRLGTNYPEGPIEWAKMIGPKEIFALLNKLAETDDRYQPHQSLKNSLAKWP